jgi:Mg-chelatase subunit ChlD
MRLRMEAARAATLALCVAFAEVEGVDVAASAFPFRVAGPRGTDTAGVVLLKGVDEDYRSAAARLADLRADGGTPLASALLHSQELVLGVPRQRRIVIVVTDGDPDSVEDVRHVIRLGRQHGVEHLGLGIGVEMGHLFDTWVRIDAVEELPRRIVDLVRDAVLQRPR